MAWYRPTLERIGNVVFILMCIAVTAVGIERLFGAAPAPPAAPPPIASGARLSLHASLRPGGAPAALVIAVSTNCQYCTASMPFYRRLAELPAVREGRLRLGIVGIQPPDQIREYFAQHGLSVPVVVHLSEAGVPLQATPTLLVINGEGAVTRSWAGRLRTDEEDAVLSEIGRLLGN